MAQDKNLPRMFSNRGDRLAFNYGIVTLGNIGEYFTYCISWSEQRH